MFMRFPIDAVFVGRPDADGCGAVVVRAPRAARVDRARAAGPRRGRRPGAAGRARSRPAPATPGAGDAAPTSDDAGVQRIPARCAAWQPVTWARRLAALDLAFPAPVRGCGREGDPICARCLPAARRAARSACRDPFGLPARPAGAAAPARVVRPVRGAVRGALHHLKYAGERRLAEPLGAAVARAGRGSASGGDLLVAGAGPRRRARQRGYDQAELIAASAARRSRPARASSARAGARRSPSSSSTGGRAANVAGAFRVRDVDFGGCASGGSLGRPRRRRRDHRLRRWLPALTPSRRRARSRSRRSRWPASADGQRLGGPRGYTRSRRLMLDDRRRPGGDA